MELLWDSKERVSYSAAGHLRQAPLQQALEQGRLKGCGFSRSSAFSRSEETISCSSEPA